MAEYFLPSANFRPPETEERGTVIFCSGGKILIQEDVIPPERALYIGELSGQSCFAADINSVPDCMETTSLRDIISGFTMPQRQAVCRAGIIAHWHRQHHVCGICGAPLTTGDSDESLLCSACLNVYFPQIAPAVIVAVEKDGRILLARNARNRNGMFGLVAGFVSAGESLEDAVRRELAEEVAIEVDDITYKGSQAWPFPNSLMAGFSARWRSGEVRPDGKEIVEAGFFTPDDFPVIPGKGSIARKLIDEFLQRS